MLLIFVVVVLYLLISGSFAFWKACSRGKEYDWLDQKAVENTSFGRHYANICAGNRWLQEHHTEDTWTQSEDGLRLHALWIPAENPKGTVLLAHGYRSCYLVDFSLAFEMYHSLGLNILVPEQRAHGQSEGRYITFGVRESDDMRCWVQHHNRTFGNHPILLSGMSMGASTMLFLADAELPENVKGIIADCGFTSPAEIIRKVYKDTVHIPAGPSLYVADVFTRIFAHFSLFEKDTRSSLAESKLPVLLIHGEADHFVPCDMSRAAYDACTGEKKLFLVPNASHGVSFLCDPKGYTQQVLTFLLDHMEDFS